MDTPCQYQSECLQQIAISMRRIEIGLESQNTHGSFALLSNVLTSIESLILIFVFCLVIYCFHRVRLPVSIQWRSVINDLLESSRNREVFTSNNVRELIRSMSQTSSSDVIFDRSLRTDRTNGPLPMSYVSTSMNVEAVQSATAPPGNVIPVETVHPTTCSHVVVDFDEELDVCEHHVCEVDVSSPQSCVIQPPVLVEHGKTPDVQVVDQTYVFERGPFIPGMPSGPALIY